MLLFKFGGIWVDATTFCLKPLTNWIDIEDSGFFCFRQPVGTIDRQFVSWFLAAKKGSSIVRDLLGEILDFATEERKINLKIAKLILNDETKEFVSREGTGWCYIRWMEDRGEVPYFWLFYIFNEIVKKPVHVKTWELVQGKPNNYANLNYPMSLFDSAFVSKQTHKPGYMKDDILKGRFELVDNILRGVTK